MGYQITLNSNKNKIAWNHQNLHAWLTPRPKTNTQFPPTSASGVLLPLRSSCLQIGAASIDTLFKGFEHGAKEIVINVLSAPKLRQCQPEDEDGLEDEPKGKPVKNNIDKIFNDIDETKHGPVGEPLHVICHTRGFKSFKRGVRRIHPSDQVSDEMAADVEKNEEKECREDGESHRNLRDLGPGLQVVQVGIF